MSDQSEAWKRTDTVPDVELPMTRMEAQRWLDWNYGARKITKEQWSQGFDNLSNVYCRDYRDSISPKKLAPLVAA